MSDPNLSSFIWSVADLLRGVYKQSEYGKIILPLSAAVTGQIDGRGLAAAPAENSLHAAEDPAPYRA